MKYSPHGELHFEIEKHLLIIEKTGPFNLESMIQAEEDVSKIQKGLYKSRWCVLVIIHGQPIHTPDAAKLLIEGIKNDRRNGRIASALVITDSENPIINRHHISEIYMSSGENFEFFSDINTAKKWLNDQLEIYHETP
ncbi:MAG: hypothetical protein JEY91_04320 [Spirochaetaceae bacterium]|nr:hypothetical protein [Spirochaetaceae bacterium]